MSSNHVLGGGEASFAIAQVAFKRMLRGGVVWVVLLVSLLAVPMALLQTLGDDSDAAKWQRFAEMWAYLPALLVPVLLAGAIGEEIEERTASYLWSRPLPRWSIVGGKLMALVPVLWVLLTASLILPGLVFSDVMSDEIPRLVLACLLGTIGFAAITAGIATVVPRFGTVISLAYLVMVDRTLAWIDSSIAKISVCYHLLNLANVHSAHQGDVESIAWLLGLTAAWFGLAAWRVRRME